MVADLGQRKVELVAPPGTAPLLFSSNVKINKVLMKGFWHRIRTLLDCSKGGKCSLIHRHQC